MRHYNGIRRVLCGFIVLALALTAAATAAGQERRVALVVGNASYADPGAGLSSPPNDAADVAGVLAKAGFQVSLLTDARRADLERAIHDFGDAIRGPTTVGLFYYSGQAAQTDGHNYLLSVDSTVQSEDELKYNATDAEMVLSKMKAAANKLDIAVFDSSYLNPYPGASRAAARGLAPFSLSVPESLVLFAAEPGRTAPVGGLRNSFFTKAFLAAASVPGQDISVVVKHLIAQVRADTGGREVAWASSNLTQDFAFVSDVASPAPAVSPSGPAGSAGAPAVNLVQNPDARQQPVTQNGWSQVSGNWSTLKPGPAEANLFFWPGRSAKGELYQDVSLASYSGWIAASGRTAHFQFMQAGAVGRRDAGMVILEARDANGTVLTSLPSPIAHYDKWTPYVLDLPLPPTTTVLRVRLIANRALGGGDSNDVYFKGLYLTLPNAVADAPSAPATPVPAAAPAAVPLPDLATLDTTAFVKALPPTRITPLVAKSGYAVASGEIAKLDARLPPLLVDAYSYDGTRSEPFRVYLAPQAPNLNLVVYLRAPSGKTSAYFPHEGTTDFTVKLEENGTYLLLVGTPEMWDLGPYVLWVFGRGSSVNGEITIFDEPDPDTFGNYMHKVALDTEQSVVYEMTVASKDFNTAVLLKDAGGHKVDGTTKSDGNTTTFTFTSPGGPLTAFVRSDGMWPTGKFTLSLRAVDLGGGK